MANETTEPKDTAAVGGSPLEAVVMRTYYISFEKNLSPHSITKSWLIRRTKNDMDTVDGLRAEIADLERESECHVWIVNWRKLAA